MDVNDVLNVPAGGQVPLPNLDLPTLHCFTDLVDCCNAPHSQRGEWYYPNGTALDFDLGGVTTFRRNRGPNGPFGPGVINGQGGAMVYGVVRLFRRGIPPERGHFYCEIPTAAGVNQTLYVNICELNNYGCPLVSNNFYNSTIFHFCSRQCAHDQSCMHA